jgi:hypothetical protein
MSIARELSQVASKVSIDENDFDRLVLGDGSPIKLGGDLILDGYAFAGAAEFIIAGDQRLEINYSSNTSTTEILSPIDNLSLASHPSRDVIIQGLTYPKVDGTNGQVLTTDGAGNLSFADASGGGGSSVGTYNFNITATTTNFDTAADTYEKVQVYVNGAFLDDDDFTFTANTGVVSLSEAVDNGEVVSIWAYSSAGVTYTNSDVDTHLNTSTATTNQLLSWTGSDYDWIDAPATYGDSDVSIYLSTNGYDTASNIVASIVDSAPTTLDTLNELAAALGDDANFSTTVTNSIATKLNSSAVSAFGLTLIDDANATTARSTLGLGSLATLSSVNASTITDNSVGAAELNVSGNGTTSQYLRSDGDGTFTWATPYTHPTYAGDDINLDTGVLSGATVISDLDFNVTTDSLGHVTDANATYNTRNLTLTDLNVSGTGTSGQVLTSDGDGTFSWSDVSGGESFAASLFHTLDDPNAYSTSASDYFGYAVSVSGNYGIVSAYQEDDAGGTQSGKAYIFDVTTGVLLHTLDNPSAYSTSASDNFGRSVAISGNYAIVGADWEDDASGTSSGKAYIFDVTTGTLLRTLDNPNAYSTSSSDYFGTSVAISGNYAIVGAYGENDAGGDFSGKAYIFNVTTGSLVHTLNNPNAYSTSSIDRFSWTVAISSNYAIVGAYAEDDAGGTDSGKAYIFDVTTGALVHTLDNPNAYSTSASDRFGFAVAIDSNYAIVGASREDDSSGNESGKAYIYNVSTGALLHTLDNPNAYGTGTSDEFGRTVAISGNYAIVGAQLEDDAGSSSGKAYIYNVSTGQLLHTLDNPNAYSTSAGDYFGSSVSISGNYAIVGAQLEDDAGGDNSGKAYIYQLSAPGYTPNADEFTSLAAAASSGGGGIENLAISTIVSGTETFDLNDGLVRYAMSPSGNITANFTNADTTNDKSTTVKIILNNSGGASMVTGVQIGGVSQTVEWEGGSAPTGSSGSYAIVTFTLIRFSSAWIVLGSAINYS